MALPQVVIIGRPNVGKSSIFNWLAGRRLAIVDDVAGVTRDRMTQLLRHNERFFELVDTGGIGINDVDDLSDEELAAFNDYSALADDQVQDIPEDVLALDRDMPNLTVKDGSMAFDEINFDDIIGPDPTKEEWEGQRRDLVLSEGEEYGR